MEKKINESLLFEHHPQDSRINGPLPTCSTLNTWEGSQPIVLEQNDEPIAVATQQAGAEVSENGVCPTITAAAGMSGNNQPYIVGNGQVHQLYLQDKCGALNCMDDQQKVMIPAEEQYDVRRLTPIECARLQGFPDDWCADVPHADSAEYKLWGNGMALPCSLYIMEGIADLLGVEV